MGVPVDDGVGIGVGVEVGAGAVTTGGVGNTLGELVPALSPPQPESKYSGRNAHEIGLTLTVKPRPERSRLKFPRKYGIEQTEEGAFVA